MSIKNRVKENFTMVVNEVLNNENLSLKAKGLYSFLCSKPDDWDFSYDGLSVQLKEGEKALRSAVRELVEAKLLLRVQKPKMNGYFTGWEWIVNPSYEDFENGSDPIGGSQNGGSQNGGSQNGNDRDGHDRNGNDISNTNLPILKSNTEKQYNTASDFSLTMETTYERTSQEYKDALKSFIDQSGLGLSYDDFIDGLIAKGYKYKNFALAYKNWNKNGFNKPKNTTGNTQLDSMVQQGHISEHGAATMAACMSIFGGEK